jgi:hypothetical protein
MKIIEYTAAYKNLRLVNPLNAAASSVAIRLALISLQQLNHPLIELYEVIIHSSLKEFVGRLYSSKLF